MANPAPLRLHGGRNRRGEPLQVTLYDLLAAYARVLKRRADRRPAP